MASRHGRTRGTSPRPDLPYVGPARGSDAAAVWTNGRGSSGPFDSMISSEGRMKSKLMHPLVAGLLLAAGPVGARVPDPFVGTWLFNSAKSHYLGAPKPQSLTVVWSAVGSGVHAVANGT